MSSAPSNVNNLNKDFIPGKTFLTPGVGPIQSSLKQDTDTQDKIKTPKTRQRHPKQDKDVKPQDKTTTKQVPVDVRCSLALCAFLSGNIANIPALCTILNGNISKKYLLNSTCDYDLTAGNVLLPLINAHWSEKGIVLQCFVNLLLILGSLTLFY